MDDLTKAKRRWKRAANVLDAAQARLKSLTGKPDGIIAAGEPMRARNDMENAEHEERKAKRRYRTLKSKKGA
jgi:hypothetical protein